MLIPGAGGRHILDDGGGGSTARKRKDYSLPGDECAGRKAWQGGIFKSDPEIAARAKRWFGAMVVA